MFHPQFANMLIERESGRPAKFSGDMFPRTAAQAGKLGDAAPEMLGFVNLSPSNLHTVGQCGRNLIGLAQRRAKF